MSTRKPITLATNYHATTVNKHRYKPSAMGDEDTLSDLYLTIDEMAGIPREPSR